MLADPLDGTRWALEYVNLHGVSHLISGRRIPEISFEDGRVSADDGVNVAEGTYTLAREVLSMDVAAVTSLPYPADVLPEHDVFEHLSRSHSAVIHGDFLHLAFAAEPLAADEPAGDADEGELVYRWEEDEAPA